MTWSVLTYRAGNESPVSAGWQLFVPSLPARINYGISAENVPYAMLWAADTEVIREQTGGKVVEWIDAPERPGRTWRARVVEPPSVSSLESPIG